MVVLLLTAEFLERLQAPGLSVRRLYGRADFGGLRLDISRTQERRQTFYVVRPHLHLPLTAWRCSCFLPWVDRQALCHRSHEA